MGPRSKAMVINPAPPSPPYQDCIRRMLGGSGLPHGSHLIQRRGKNRNMVTNQAFLIFHMFRTCLFSFPTGESLAARYPLFSGLKKRPCEQRVPTLESVCKCVNVCPVGPPAAVFWDQEEGVVYYNAKHTDSFWKIRKADGKVLWAVGRYDNMTLLDQSGGAGPPFGMVVGSPSLYGKVSKHQGW